MAGIYDKIGHWIERPVRNSAVAPAALPSLQDGPRAKHGPITVKTCFGNPSEDPGTRGTWTYTYLEYIPGMVTTSTLKTSGGLMTGWITGCWLVKYIQDDVPYLAHVGTNVDNADHTRAVKRIMREHVNLEGVTSVFGANPARTVSMTVASDASRAGFMPKIAGWFDPNGSARIATFGQPQSGVAANSGYLKLLDVSYLSWQDWGDINDFAASGDSDGG